MLPPPPALRLFAATALLLCMGSAHAQYSWIGENGVRHFSDLPPPPGTPAHKILKAPGRPALNPATVPAPAPMPATPAKAKDLPSLLEREKAYLERAKQREKQEAKESQDAQRQREIAQNCQSARELKAQAESGIRVARVDAKGERRFMTDEEKAAQAALANRVLAACR
jgi:hypothetical protein